MTVESWTCARCGEVHEGLPLDFGWSAPYYWNELDDDVRAERGWLTEDVCRIEHDDQTDFFVRGVLEIPVGDLGTTLRYGVWSSVSEDTFNAVIDRWDDDTHAGTSYFGWLSNWPPAYPKTLGLPVEVVIAEFPSRPSIELHDGDHPLIREQRDGITSERVREIAEQNLHRV